MASIVIPITSARQLQQQFKEYGRDYYPSGVYESLIEMFEENYGEDEPYELDVIGLCYDIQEITADDLTDEYYDPDDADNDDETILDALTEQASDEGYLLWSGVYEGKPVVYYI